MGLLAWLFGRKSRESEDESIAHLAGPGTFSFDIVGESNYQAALESICGGHSFEGQEKSVKAFLFHEDNNPYDAKAIRVDIERKTVGYLSRENAREYRRKLQEAGYPPITAACSAKIVGGWDRGSGDKGHFGVKLDLPTANHPSRGSNDMPNPSEFSFSIVQPNPQEFTYVKIGDYVNFWAPADNPTKIFIYRHGSIGGQGMLGLVPKTYSEVIANHRASKLPIETEITSVNTSTCTISCRLVEAEEIDKAENEKKQKLYAELNKPYRPKKPVEFSIDAKSNALNPGDRLRLKQIPSVNECVEDIYGAVFVFVTLDEKKIIEKSDEPAIKKKIVRLTHTFDGLDIQIISKANKKHWYKSEYKLRITPIDT